MDNEKELLAIDFGEKVSHLIRKKNAEHINAQYTKEILAKQTGIPLSTIESYIKGTRTPSIMNAKKIAKYLDSSIDYLAGMKGALDISQSEQTSETFLKNLCIVIANANLKVQTDNIGNTVISTSNQYIKSFLDLTRGLDYNDSEKIDKIIQSYSGLRVWKGELVDKDKYLELAKEDFVKNGLLYGKAFEGLIPITQHDYEEYPNESRDNVMYREELWSELLSKNKIWK